MYKILISILNNKSLLVPNYRVKNVSTILNIEELMGENKKIFIFDKDDTLVSLHQFKVIDT